MNDREKVSARSVRDCERSKESDLWRRGRQLPEDSELVELLSRVRSRTNRRSNDDGASKGGKSKHWNNPLGQLCRCGRICRMCL